MYICGQTSCLSKIDSVIAKKRFPNFSLILGSYGSGKRLLSDYIARKLKAFLIPCRITIDSVREAIIDINSSTEKCVFLFADADKMSVSALNAMLKVSEECPENSYIILTAPSRESLMDTIVNRAFVINTDSYSYSDITDFIEHRNLSVTAEERAILNEVCSTPGEVLSYSESNIVESYSLAEKFIEFANEANIANLLKITTMLNVKKDSDGGVDVALFMKLVILSARNLMLKFGKNAPMYCDIISCTNKYLGDLLTINPMKELLVDNWILSLYSIFHEV